MFTKRYMYESERRSCLEILEKGFVKSFEEVFPLRKILKPAMRFLKEAEKWERKGDQEKCLESRLKAGDCLQEYEWLSKYFYKTGSKQSYQFLAQIEEKAGNLKEALRCLKKAITVTSDKDHLWNHVLKVYQTLGPKYLKNEKEFKYFSNLLEYPNGSLQNKSAGYRLLSRAMLRLDRHDEALQYFQRSLELSEQSNDVNGMCDAYLAMSELRDSPMNPEEALSLCRDLSEKHSLKIFIVVSSLRLGQIKTEKGDYGSAHQLFKAAYETTWDGSPEWLDLCSVMYGVGKAHVTMESLIKTFEHTNSIKSLLRWKGMGLGPYG
ncbi:tetratricopeptide repeat protein 29-like [Parasteatoda tepidariorum]|uniref:tetratricopeptide repeat protein 29-like n=1 Tax=Parasteatoda tepidariorum TaxID=114398 RepID=UPI0039BCA2CC